MKKAEYVISQADLLISQMDELMKQEITTDNYTKQLYAIKAYRDVLWKCRNYLSINNNVANKLYDSLSSGSNAEIFITLAIEKTQNGLDEDQDRIRALNDLAGFFLFVVAVAMFITSLAIAAFVAAYIWAPLLVTGIIGMFVMMPGSSYAPSSNILLKNPDHHSFFAQTINNPYGADKLQITLPTQSSPG